MTLKKQYIKGKTQCGQALGATYLQSVHTYVRYPRPSQMSRKPEIRNQEWVAGWTNTTSAAKNGWTTMVEQHMPVLALALSPIEANTWSVTTGRSPTNVTPLPSPACWPLPRPRNGPCKPLHFKWPELVGGVTVAMQWQATTPIFTVT